MARLAEMFNCDWCHEISWPRQLGTRGG